MPSIQSELKVLGFTEADPAIGIDSDGWTAVTVDTGVRPRAGGMAVAALDYITVHLDSISGADSVTAKVTSDADGDIPLGPVSTAGDIVTGETTATTGSVSFDGGRVMFSSMNPVLSDNGTWIVTLWLKTNAGSADVTSVTFGARP